MLKTEKIHICIWQNDQSGIHFIKTYEPTSQHILYVLCAVCLDISKAIPEVEARLYCLVILENVAVKLKRKEKKKNIAVNEYQKVSIIYAERNKDQCLL